MLSSFLYRDTKAEVVRNIKAMFMHKIGTILVNSTDSLIISSFIGVVALGLYSNYTLIAGVAAGTLGLFFSPLTSVVGHLCVTGNPKQTKHRSFRILYACDEVSFAALRQ